MIFCVVLENKVAKPKDWKKNLWELDTKNPDNNGLQNEDLIVWMRTAAFPNFRKLYRRIEQPLKGEKGKSAFTFFSDKKTLEKNERTSALKFQNISKIAEKIVKFLEAR